MMFKNAVEKLAVGGAAVLVAPLLAYGVADWATAQTTNSGNPEILAAVRQLQSSVNALQGSVEGLQRKRFYLTRNTSFDGSQPLTACASGYHMASLWEILDPSNLQYETELGLSDDDSGSGPPAGTEGWVRTGTSTSGSGAAGVNCDVWTSNTAEGTVAEIDWLETTGTFPWDARDDGCNQHHPVWCVQD